MMQLSNTGCQRKKSSFATVDDSKKSVSVLQTGTKYTNDYWMQFWSGYGCILPGEMEANDVLANMDTNRAEAAKTVGDC